jgi:CO/xanthine dehydrogenase FAD-binding subunit
MKYFRPQSLQELFELEKSLADNPRTILAGGTDLLPRFERGVPLPDILIDIKDVSELNAIKVSDDRVEIGALTSIQDIQDHELIRSEFKALHLAATDFAGAQIRHRGTLGGNLCNASPAGDLLPALYAFEAGVVLGRAGKKTNMPIQSFVLAPGKKALEPGQLVLGVVLRRSGFESHFEKVGLRQSMAISVVNAAFVYQIADRRFTHLKITAGSVAPTIVSLDAFTSAYLQDQTSVDEKIDLIDENISPIDDIRATATYRRRVLKNLVKHFLNQVQVRP